MCGAVTGTRTAATSSQDRSAQSKTPVMKSPAGGIPPYDLAKVVGRVTLKALHEDDFLSFEVLGTPEGAPLARS